MDVFITRTDTHDEIHIELGLDATVQDALGKVTDSLGVLVFNDVILKNSTKFSDLEVTDGSMMTWQPACKLHNRGIIPSEDYVPTLRVAIRHSKNKIKATQIVLNDPRTVITDKDSGPTLKYCAQRDLNKVISLILQDPRIDPTEHGPAIVIDMIKRSFPDTLKVLLDDDRISRGVNFTKLVEKAASRDSTEVIKYLMKRATLLPTYTIILMKAVQSRNHDNVKAILEDSRIAPNDDIFYTAISMRELDIIKLFIDDGRVSVSDIHPDRMGRIMRDITSSGEIDVIKLLVENGANPDIRMCLADAVESNSLDVVKLFVETYNINPRLDSSILTEAVECGNNAIFEYLLNDPRVDPRHNDEAICITCMDHHSIDIIELLLDDGRVDFFKFIGISGMKIPLTRSTKSFIGMTCSRFNTMFEERYAFGSIMCAHDQGVRGHLRS